jgi:hypothetical protein
MAAIEQGAEVVTSDGKVLGHVKETTSTAFLVDVPRRANYWLETTIVGSANTVRVELLVSEADISSYRMDRPGDLTAFQQEGVDPQVINRMANPRAQ